MSTDPSPSAPDETAPPAGVMDRIAPGIRRILAPNPSPMTYWGTNTFAVGTGDVTVIDPGPADPAHMRALLDGLDRGERIARILVTHAHLDHSALARPLAEATGAPVLGFGPPDAGRSPVMAALVARGLAGGGEGVDRAFAPDERIGDGDRLDLGDGLSLEVVWTPGHFAGHLSFALGDTLFTGDHVMGWASTLISPPDGDLTAFLASCARLALRRDRLYLPAHGAAIADPGARLAWLVAHRREREAQVMEALAAGPATVPALVGAIYADTARQLWPAAARNVFAQLIDLDSRGLVRARPELSPEARFERVG
ncbi:MAG: MBL fold metallo-hydrolase [Maritimibacter sp.]|nr:MBL fold metallo-hydrolase [Maritimibacter sp.]